MQTRPAKNSVHVIFPSEDVYIAGPLIFLAGPIQSAQDWQKRAIGIIRVLDRNISIACPRRDYLTEDFVYEKQVDWETRYLRRAGKDGVVLFWLAKESKHNCERAYAQTSRFELGEWKTRHEFTGAKLVVGIQNGFTNARYIRRRLAQDCPDVPVCTSLKETCVMAVRLAKKKK